MVLTFELYCRGCGCKLLAVNEPLDVASHIHVENTVDSWLSEIIRDRLTRCPNCGRTFTASPMVRAEIMFGEWDDSVEKKAKSVTFYL